MRMLIRPLNCSDIRGCADIAIECWNHNVADRVVDQITEGFYRVIEIDGGLAGFVGARKSFLANNAWEIPWIAVSPKHQGKHVGTALLEHMMHELCELRRASIVLAVTQKTYFFEGAGFGIVQSYDAGWCLMTKQNKPVGL